MAKMSKPMSFDEWQKEKEKRAAEMAKKMPDNSVVAAMTDEAEEHKRQREHMADFDEMRTLVRHAQDAFEDGTDFDTVVTDLVEAIKCCASMKGKKKPVEVEAIGY